MLGTLLMTSVGLFAVSQTIQPVRDAMDSTGDALRQQARVLSRGSDSGSVNGMSGGSGGGMSGFDLGSFTGAATSILGQVSKFADGQQGGNQPGINGQGSGEQGAAGVKQ